MVTEVQRFLGQKQNTSSKYAALADKQNKLLPKEHLSFATMLLD